MQEKKIVIYEDEWAIVYYWPEMKLVENKWKKETILTDDKYRKPFVEALKFAETTQVDYFLSDIRQEGIVPHKEKKWFKDYAIPEAVKRNVKLAAIIIDFNVFKTYYINALIKFGNNLGLPIKTFNNYSKAIKWLTNKYKQ